MENPQTFETPDEPARGSGLPVDRIGLVLGTVVFAGWLLLVNPGSLSQEAHRLAGVMLLTVIWWITEPIPIPVTGFLAILLCVVLGAVPADERGRIEAARVVFAPFADPSVFFLLGGLFIGRAMTRHGLDRRLALTILCTRWAGRSPTTMLGAVGLAVTIVSMWISNTAATAMMYPVTLGIISVLAASGPHGTWFTRSPYASALLLITAYASSVGGIATPIGTATNVVALGYFRQPEYFGRTVDFLSWSLIGVPMMLVIFAGLFVWLRTDAPGIDMPALRQYFEGELARLGRWKRGEWNTLVVFLVVVSLWVTPGVLAMFAPEHAIVFSARLPEEIVALLAPVLLYFLPVNWSQRKFTLDVSDFSRLDWGTILLFGAGLSLGSLMFKTGLARAVGEGIFASLGTHDIWAITAVSIAGGIVLSEFTGNAATAATLIPVIAAICRSASVDLAPPLLGVTFGASFGSALPVSTPPNAIVYSSGLLPVRRMVRAGLGLDVLAGVTIWCVLRIAYAIGWRPFADTALR